MAFVLTYMLNLFGVMKFLGDTCGGVMGAFDLPGEAITVLSRHVALLRRRCRRCRQPGRCRPAQCP